MPAKPLELNFSPKDPDAVVRKTVDWVDFLPEDDTIDSVTITPAGGIVTENQLIEEPERTKVSVTLKEGTAGTVSTVHYRITTSGGTIDERTVGIEISEK